MALKDWKKEHSTNTRTRWKNKITGDNIAIHNRRVEETETSIWTFAVSTKPSYWDVDYIFKTKSQALKYAKAFMRKN